MKADFSNLSPEARRLILVCSDANYREFIGQIDWVKVLKLVATPIAVYGFPYLAAVSAVLGPAAARSAYLGATWAAAAVGASSKQNWFERLTTKGEIPIPHLEPAEAAGRFKFDFGEPRDGTAYVLNPCVADHYLVPAMANERLAQEKMAAFTQMAAALGAKRVEVVSGEALSTFGGVSANVPIEEAAAQIGLGVSFGGEHRVKRQVVMEFDEPDSRPFLPVELARWTELDPSLRALVATRLNARPRIAKVNLTFEDTVDVDAKVTAELADRKIGVGGKYRQIRASSWSFEIEFWPVQRSG